jgi:hypothetical protein
VDVAELVLPLIVLYVAESFRSLLSELANDTFDVFDGECDVPDA